MAVYKVPQDVEADDKFLGPLSFKQFLFMGGAAISGYLAFLLISRGATVFAFIFLPFFIIFAALAFPWNRDQPTEIWLASRIRFMLFSKKRIWDQSGVKDSVTITVPKRDVHVYSDGLNQDQVKGRLSALASVVDSRGWALKNIQGQGSQQQATAQAPPSDRLVEPTVPKEPSQDNIVLNAADDILDKSNKPLENQFDSMIKESQSKHHEETLKMVDEALHPKAKPAEQAKQGDDDYWFLNQPDQPTDPNLAKIKTNAVVSPGQKQSAVRPSEPGQVEEDFLHQVHKKQKNEKKANQLGRIKTIKPLKHAKDGTVIDENDHSKLPTVVNDNSPQKLKNQTHNATGKTPVDPGILALAHNDDLNVETLARQANKNDPDDEVVVDLR